MREPLGKRLIKAMEEILAATEEESNRLKKVKEGMQEAGNDKYVDDKSLQKKILPNGIRNGKQPADVPLEIDELSYSKKSKQKYTQIPPNQPTINDANTAEVKMDKDKKEKKYDINRIEQIHSAWKEMKEAKKAKEEQKYDINRIEKVKTSRADEDGDEGIDMAIGNLKSIANLSTSLIANLQQGNTECLSEAWVQSKLTLAEDYVSVVHDYVMYKTENNMPKDNAFFGNFDGHDGHSKLNKDQSDYERGNF